MFENEIKICFVEILLFLLEFFVKRIKVRIGKLGFLVKIIDNKIKGSFWVLYFRFGLIGEGVILNKCW